MHPHDVGDFRSDVGISITESEKMTDLNDERIAYAESVASSLGGRDDAVPYALLAIAEALNNVAEALRPRRDSDMLRGMSAEQVRAWGEAVTGRGETS